MDDNSTFLSLLIDSYQRGDWVNLIIFLKDRAVMVLYLTNSVILAERALTDIPIAGKTPLSDGLQLS